MIHVKGQILWLDLNLFFIDAEKLGQYWKQKSFSGYSRIDVPEWQGWMLCVDGDVIMGIQQLESDQQIRTDAVNEIMTAITQERVGTITICQLPATVVNSLQLAFPHSRAQFENTLESHKHSFSDLIEDLRQQAFEGYLLLTYNSDRSRALVTLSGGEMVAIQTKDIVFNLQTTSQSGNRYINHFVEGAQHKGVDVDLYRVT